MTVLSGPEGNDLTNSLNHKWDVLAYRGKYYYRESLFNGLIKINPNYKIHLVRRFLNDN